MAFTHYKKDKNNKDISIKNAYYTFSKDYPITVFEQKKSHKKKPQAKKVIKVIFLVALFFVISFSTFFVCQTLISFSNKDVTLTMQNDDEVEKSNVFIGDTVRAIRLNETDLNETKKIRKAIKKIRSNDQNSVIIPFKTESGKLCFSSNNSLALKNKTALYSNQSVVSAINLFQSKGIHVIAEVCCFEDDLMARANPAFSVKYLNSGVTWLDESSQSGKAWLDPFNNESNQYLFSIIKEVAAFGVDAISLKSVNFPTTGALLSTSFARLSADEKNKALLDFVKNVKIQINDCVPLFVEVLSNDATGQNNTYLFGKLNNADCYGFFVDMRQNKIPVDKKDGFNAFFAHVAKIKNSFSEDKNVTVIFDEKDFSRKLKKQLEASNNDNYILK